MKAWVAKASRPEVVGGIGGFAGLFDASALTSYRRPLLATSTDGVGTKVAIAAAADRHDTIGHDLVGMVVDDLVVCGAEPLFMTDYIACGKVVPERIASIVKGIAEGCVLAGLRAGRRRDRRAPRPARPRRVRRRRRRARASSRPTRCSGRTGSGPATCWSRWRRQRAALQRLLAGPARAALAAGAGWALDREVDELGRPLVDELLEPTRIYALDCLALIAGGRGARDEPRHRRRARGQPGPGPAVPPLGRRRPRDRGPRSRSSAWSQQVGGIAEAELERTLNLGVGMVAVVATGVGRRRRAHCSPAAGCRPGSPARCATATAPSRCTAPTPPDVRRPA